MAKARTASSTGLTAWGGGVYNCGYCQGDSERKLVTTSTLNPDSFRKTLRGCRGHACMTLFDSTTVCR